MEAHKSAFAFCAFLLSGCLVAHALTAHTGHMYVTVTDAETGGPVTNATLTVRCQTEFNIGRTLERYFTKTSAQTDTNGVAHVEFQFYESDFNWWVESPSYYSNDFGFGHGDEHFGCIVEESDYMDINTNTVEGMAMYNELVRRYNSGDYYAYAELFMPKSVTYTNNVARRSVCLTPKHNPQPMYAHGDAEVCLPMKGPTTFVTNGVEVTRYKPVDFDLQECLVVEKVKNPRSRFADDVGKVADFRIERFSVTTNGVHTTYGWLDFAPGCGAYVTKLPGAERYPLIYEADTNAVFLSRIPFEYSYVNGKCVYRKPLVRGDECMVLRTRAVTNAAGEVTSCRYAKIYGPMSALKRVGFSALIVNPRPNDPNLEFDMEHNLVEYGERCYRP